MKPFWKSKTETINIIAIAGSVLQLVLQKNVIPIDPQKQILILAGINAILRFITKEPISIKKGETK